MRRKVVSKCAAVRGLASKIIVKSTLTSPRSGLIEPHRVGLPSHCCLVLLGLDSKIRNALRSRRRHAYRQYHAPIRLRTQARGHDQVAAESAPSLPCIRQEPIQKCDLVMAALTLHALLE